MSAAVQVKSAGPNPAPAAGHGFSWPPSQGLERRERHTSILEARAAADDLAPPPSMQPHQAAATISMQLA